MESRKQFSLRNLLIEVTLIAVTLAAARVAVTRYEDPLDPRILLSVMALASLPALCGAVVGGLVGQFGKGALWGSIAVGAIAMVFALLW